MKKIDYNSLMKDQLEEFEGEKKTLLLHSCCAPCSSYVLEKLNTYFDITILFYNPNIHPKSEYIQRLEELKIFYKEFLPNADIKVVEGEYLVDKFFQVTDPYKDVREGGERCFKCYRLRMEEAASYAKSNGIDFFTTALSISPHKNSKVINEIGIELEEKFKVKYLRSDFKKENGFKRSIELSKIYNLYRQDYCGCVYSKKERGL
ncbi:MAG: recombinase [Candidatus Cloacimonadota bacterium]|nr:MAG: recombinase [Candidatus Cloacimonadota bacterium]PIE81106.1 MAG: recombinase [Candidatus Delongbacteria bacterium]